MKDFIEISPSQIEDNVFDMIGKQWFLITAGDKNGYNTMTASWGYMGVIWNKNVAVCVVRPVRHTYQFIEKSEYYTLSFFGEQSREALKFCGAKSGRNFDKAKETGLTPLFFDKVTSFEQAELILLCKKLYINDIDPKGFLDSSLDRANYPNKDYHRAYTGEIIKVYEKIK